MCRQSDPELDRISVSRARARKSARTQKVRAQAHALVHFARYCAKQLRETLNFRARSAREHPTSDRIRRETIGYGPTSDLRERCARENRAARTKCARANMRVIITRAPARTQYPSEANFAKSARAKLRARGNPTSDRIRRRIGSDRTRWRCRRVWLVQNTLCGH